MKKKRVLIIEDELSEFTAIKNLVIRNGFDCPQDYTEADYDLGTQGSFINNLRNALLVTCRDDLHRKERDCAISKIKEELESYKTHDFELIYLVDYRLDTETNSLINGINFKTKFINDDTPVLFVTGAARSELRNVQLYVKGISNKSKCYYCAKPDPDQWINAEQDILTFIKGNDKKGDLTNEYE
jgi:hypothetical protein